MGHVKKPPLGLMPEAIFESKNNRDRIIEVAKAINRYTEAGLTPPDEWFKELERRMEVDGLPLTQLKKAKQQAEEILNKLKQAR